MVFQVKAMNEQNRMGFDPQPETGSCFIYAGKHGSIPPSVNPPYVNLSWGW
jgi:hypothetical protein